MDALIIEHLKINHRDRILVKDVSFTIQSSEIVGLLGPNGAGKTTCFHVILGMLPVNGGRVLLNNLDITKLKIHERARLGIGYLPQEASIFRKLSVYDNVMSILELREDLKTLQQRKNSCEALLEDFNVFHLKKNMGFTLSGGERRRVEVARALALNPKFILLDEPFAGVDPISVVDIKHIIYQLQQRKVGILVTDHNVRETLDICNRAYIINRGEIIASGSSKEILSDRNAIKFYLGERFSIN